MQHRRSIRVRSAVLAFAVAIMGVVTGVGASPAYAATDYWVAPTGADTNGGTQTAPFKTLQKALDVAAPGTTINLSRRDLPRGRRHQDRRHRHRADHDQGSGDRQGRQRPLQGRAVRARRARVQHQPQLLHAERLHDRRPAEHRPHRVPRRLLVVADPDVQGLGAGPRRQQQAGLRRRIHHAVRHRRHDDLGHVPQRLRRGVRAVPRPRREQPDRQLDDPVVRDARPGQRRRPVQVPQRRGRLRRHEPEVDRPAPVRQRHEQQHRRAQLHDQHLRLRVLRGEGERAPQPHGEQQVRVERRAVDVPGQQRRVPR